jgi:hypothetical protein
VLQFGERRSQALQHFSDGWRDSVHARVTRSLGFCRTQPSSPSHSSQQRVQGAWTQPITVPLQLLEHPLAVHPVLLGMVQDVDLPESKKELADDGVTHR